MGLSLSSCQIHAHTVLEIDSLTYSQSKITSQKPGCLQQSDLRNAQLYLHRFVSVHVFKLYHKLWTDCQAACNGLFANA